MWKNIYNDICYYIAANIDTNFINNKIIIKKLFLQPSKIGMLNPEDFAPLKYKKIKKEFENRFLIKTKIKYSTLYKCPQCKNYKVIMKSIQNRSLDECANIELTCVNCSYHWYA